MSKKKRKIRENFRNQVFERDNYLCRVCGAIDIDLDAHHITNREEMVAGGYVAENGISLCSECHLKAEECYMEYFKKEQKPPETLLSYTPEKLYELIGSSFKLACKKSEKFAYEQEE